MSYFPSFLFGLCLSSAGQTREEEWREDRREHESTTRAMREAMEGRVESLSTELGVKHGHLQEARRSPLPFQLVFYQPQRIQ